MSQTEDEYRKEHKGQSMCGIGSEKDMGHESRRTLQHMDQDLSRAFHGTKVVVVVVVVVCM